MLISHSQSSGTIFYNLSRVVLQLGITSVADAWKVSKYERHDYLLCTFIWVDKLFYLISGVQ